MNHKNIRENFYKRMNKTITIDFPEVENTTKEELIDSQRKYFNLLLKNTQEEIDYFTELIEEIKSEDKLSDILGMANGHLSFLEKHIQSIKANKEMLSNLENLLNC